MNAHANTTSFANTDIIIENVFSYDDVLKLSGLCNYEPFCDEPEAEDLIQLALLQRIPTALSVYFVFKPYY